MFFRKAILLLSTISLSFTLNGCSKPITESPEESVAETLTDEDLFSLSLDLFNSEDVRSTTTVYTTTYDDGTTSSETENIIYNATDGIIEKSYTASDNSVQKTYYVKDGQDIYCYENDDTYENGWVRYAENPDDNGETSFDYTLAEFTYDFNEDAGYTDVTLTNEGEDLLNGIHAIKLSITATPLSDENPKLAKKKAKGRVTRKDIIKEFGWSEESVNAVEGFSEILDQYVAYQNKDEVVAINTEDSTETYTVWIAKDSSRILQLQSSFSIENTAPVISSDIEDIFWDNCWKVDWIQSDIDDGLSVEVAKEILELEGIYVEEQLEYEDSLEIPDESVSETGALAKEVTYVKTFLIGDNCPPITEIPDKFTETTYEDYYTAFEE